MNIEKYEEIENRYQEVESLLAKQEIIADQTQYQKLAKEFSDIIPIVNLFREYKKIVRQEKDINTILFEKPDKDFKELADAELTDLISKRKNIEKSLIDFINPKKKERNRNLIVEIRAGTGGEEASLFASDLYRMYLKYCDKKGWKVDPISISESGTGGIKEIVFSISGKGAEKHLQWESGVHRVQRVPTTEASGRIHTSAATVAVLFEPEEIDITINPSDLKIDIFRSSGPGGQSVNTTDSAVRITHLPSGLVVICQDERAQLKNKHKAMRVLRARLMDKIQQEKEAKESQDRKLKVGSGDRSEKIRTYNFPDRRVTDHRIGLTLYKLNFIMDGDLDEMTEALIKASEEEELK